MSGQIRAAAGGALAFLACHSMDAKGDECLYGPFRLKLIKAGAMEMLLDCVLDIPAEDVVSKEIIDKAASLGIMYLSTMVNYDSIFFFLDFL